MKTRWISISLFAVLSVLPLHAQQQTGQITDIAHIAYRAADLGKEVAFFQKLGFEQAFANTSPDGKVTQSFIKVNDHQFIEIYPQTEPGQELGWMHVCYESDDLNALFTALDAHGLKPSPARKAGAGNLLSVLRDPEGRVTEFTQYMPGSRHTLDQGKHLGEHRVSELMSGFELPVPDLESARKFYSSGLGLEGRETRNGLRFTSPAAPEMRIQIRTAGASAKPATIFRVADVEAAAKQLQAVGLSVTQQRNRITVTDPDGNEFMFTAPRMRWQDRE
jgi:catechol 2,3-dioxygenase-like lactoylglutathione lyase family enzyme